MLREAARWALSAPFPPEQLPGSYATIYTLSTLEPPIIEAAKEEGLIKPTLSRAELERWRKAKVTVGRDQRQALEQRIARLNRDRARIEEELRKAEAELQALNGGAQRR